MKKIFMAAVVATIAISSFSSCNKTYRCSCTATTMINDSLVSTVTTTKEYRTTKADARNKCASWTQHAVTGRDTTHTSNDCSFQ